MAVESRQTAALVEFGAERAWIAPESRERPELGARTAAHAWRNPKWVDYRRSLSDDPAFAERPDGRRRVRFPPAYDLDPYPALRSTNLPATVHDRVPTNVRAEGRHTSPGPDRGGAGDRRRARRGGFFPRRPDRLAEGPP